MEKILREFRKSPENNPKHENLQQHTEHGQDWVSCLACGATWSVHDSNKGHVFEEVSHGDESCS